MDRNLTVGDGFRFGCGFISAVVAFYIIGIILAAVVMGVMALLGMGNFFPQMMGFPR